MQLERHFVEKPWGRSDVPAAFNAPAMQRIGEIWYDVAGDSTLPLLVKWLFTSEKLSIQVHPDNAQAQARGQPSGKEECWYIVDAEPGAVLGMGTLKPLSADELRAASLSGDIEQLMDWKPVKAGDWFYIPAGTVHAIGAGITLVEIQQNADITYRLYDYGRPRELHLDDGVAVSRAAPYADPRHGEALGSRQLIDGPLFRLWLADGDMPLGIPETGRRWIVPIKGDVLLGDETVWVGQCALDDAGQALTITAGSAALIASA